MMAKTCFPTNLHLVYVLCIVIMKVLFRNYDRCLSVIHCDDVKYMLSTSRSCLRNKVNFRDIYTECIEYGVKMEFWGA